MAELKIELPAPVSGRLPVLDELKGLAIILVILFTPAACSCGTTTCTAISGWTCSSS